MPDDFYRETPVTIEPAIGSTLMISHHVKLTGKQRKALKALLAVYGLDGARPSHNGHHYLKNLIDNSMDAPDFYQPAEEIIGAVDAVLASGCCSSEWQVTQTKPVYKSMDNPTKLSVTAGIGVIIIFLLWLFCFNHVGVTNIGIAYNSISGEIKTQDHPGWYITSPMVQVAHMSLLPMRVTIPSEARIINQKMVRFRREGAVEFIKLQGFDLDLISKQENIMLGYAFSGQHYPFLEILEEPKVDSK